jgi:hypothetical protein
MDKNNTILTDSFDQLEVIERLRTMRIKTTQLLCSFVDIQLLFCDLHLKLSNGALQVVYDHDDLMGVLTAERGMTEAISKLADALDKMINDTFASVGDHSTPPGEDTHAQDQA